MPLLNNVILDQEKSKGKSMKGVTPKKVRRARKLSWLSHLILIFVCLYALMGAVKSVYVMTASGGSFLDAPLYSLAKLIIESTWTPVTGWIWNNIPTLNGDVLNFYKFIAPPALIAMICGLFIIDYRALKAKDREYEAELEKEEELRRRRKERGLDTLSEKARIDIQINDSSYSPPAWHEKAWGKIFLGVTIIAIAVALDLE